MYKKLAKNLTDFSFPEVLNLLYYLNFITPLLHTDSIIVEMNNGWADGVISSLNEVKSGVQYFVSTTYGIAVFN